MSSDYCIFVTFIFIQIVKGILKTNTVISNKIQRNSDQSETELKTKSLSFSGVTARAQHRWNEDVNSSSKMEYAIILKKFFIVIVFRFSV